MILLMWFWTIALHPAEADLLFNPAVNYGADDWPYSVAISDLNGDANPDLVVANRYSRNVSVQLSNGDSSFQKLGELKSQ